MKPHEIIEYVMTEVAKEYKTHWRALLKTVKSPHRKKAKAIAVGIISLTIDEEVAQDMFSLSKTGIRIQLKQYLAEYGQRPHPIQTAIYEALKAKQAA